MTTERIPPPLTGDERETLRAFLDYHRATLAMKCDGLGDHQVAYDAAGATRAEAFAVWQAEVEHSRRIEREAGSLDITGHNAKWNADLLREGIDGVVGA